MTDFALHALQWEQSAGRFYISILNDDALWWMIMMTGLWQDYDRMMTGWWQDDDRVMIGWW